MALGVAMDLKGCLLTSESGGRPSGAESTVVVAGLGAGVFLGGNRDLLLGVEVGAGGVTAVGDGMFGFSAVLVTTLFASAVGTTVTAPMDCLSSSVSVESTVDLLPFALGGAFKTVDVEDGVCESTSFESVSDEALGMA